LGQDDNPGSNPVKVTRSSFKINDERKGGKLLCQRKVFVLNVERDQERSAIFTRRQNSISARLVIKRLKKVFVLNVEKDQERSAIFTRRQNSISAILVIET